MKSFLAALALTCVVSGPAGAQVGIDTATNFAFAVISVSSNGSPVCVAATAPSHYMRQWIVFSNDGEVDVYAGLGETLGASNGVLIARGERWEIKPPVTWQGAISFRAATNATGHVSALEGRRPYAP